MVSVTKNIKILFISILLLSSTEESEKNQEAPLSVKLDVWMEDIKGKIDELSKSIPVTMAAVNYSGKDSFKYITGIDRNHFSGISYLRFLSTADMDWNQKINAPFLKGKKGLDLVFESTGANILFVETAKNNLLVLSSKQKFPIKSKSETLRKNPSQFVAEVFKTLGYDGVILDRRGDHFLIGLYSKAIGRVGDQALVLKNTESQIVVTKNKKDGAAILNSIEVKDGFGVFKILLKGEDDKIPVGTKVISERAK